MNVLKIGILTPSTVFVPDYKRDLYDLYGVEGLLNLSTGKHPILNDNGKEAIFSVHILKCFVH